MFFVVFLSIVITLVCLYKRNQPKRSFRTPVKEVGRAGGTKPPTYPFPTEIIKPKPHPLCFSPEKYKNSFQRSKSFDDIKPLDVTAEKSTDNSYPGVSSRERWTCGSPGGSTYYMSE